MVAPAVEFDRDLDAVFATPPEEFVAARDDLVKRLRAEKRRDEAAAVATLRRPNRLVWGLNQLALNDDDTLAPLLAAVDAVREPPGGDLRAAVAGLRDAVNDAVAAAVGRFDDARSSDRADLAAALHTVVADEDAIEALASGRLVELPAASAFGLPAAPPGAKPRAKAKAKAEPKGRAKAKAAAKEPPAGPDPLAVKRAEKAEQEAAAAAEAAERGLAAAEDAFEAAEDRAEDAAAAVEEAKAEHERALEALSDADAAQSAAAAEVAATAEALAKARDDLTELNRS